MLQPWEQDEFENMTEEQMKKDCDEITNKIEKLYIIFVGCPYKGVIPESYYKEPKNFKEHQKDLQKLKFKYREEYEPTIFEEALKFQQIIEMYLEFIIQSGNFGNYNDKFQHLLSLIDDVVCELQKFYKQLEKQYAEKLIEKGGWR